MSPAVAARLPPELDPGFLPAALFNRAYRRAAGGKAVAVRIRRGRAPEVSRPETLAGDAARDERFLERLAKFLIWRHGGEAATVDGDARLARRLEARYASGGARAFDAAFWRGVFADAESARFCPPGLGGHWEGCRVGFDLGASDRKCAAVRDGRLVFSEEAPWDPAAEPDPARHAELIRESVRRAAEQLPRVDAIGGCAAGVILDGQPRVSSLFRGVPDTRRDAVRGVFHAALADFPGVPWAVVNDGACAALAAAGGGPALALALGSSLAAGCVEADGRLADSPDELAFAPIDYREDAPLDAWSGDRGCAVQYLSQQALGRLMERAAIPTAPGLPDPARLELLQALAAGGDARAERVYRTLGAYLGYALLHYQDFYGPRRVMLLGRVTSGRGGELLAETAMRVLAAESEGRPAMTLELPGERERRHGQAVAAASLVPLGAAR